MLPAGVPEEAGLEVRVREGACWSLLSSGRRSEVTAKPGPETQPRSVGWTESRGTPQPRATLSDPPALLAGPISTPGLTHSTLLTPASCPHSDSAASGGCQQEPAAWPHRKHCR